MESLYNKYKNIRIFATSTEYRGYKPKDELIPFEKFKENMNEKGYVLDKFFKDKIPVDIYLFSTDSKVISTTLSFKKLLDHYKKGKPQHLILITENPLNVYRRKTILQYKHLSIFNYYHKHFIIEVNKGPLCSKHSILNIEETRKVCLELMAHGHKFPAIFEDDIQNIWIGGEINQIIKIESISEISGYSIHYRIVTSSAGKISQTSTTIVEEIEEDVKDQKKMEEPLDEDLNENYEDYIDTEEF